MSSVFRLSLIILLMFQGISLHATETITPSLPPGYAVASAHPLATNAGLEVLAAGGNAFDAAVAVSAALAVVEPYHSGLGGGGFWLLHDEKNKKNIIVDGREVAPLAATEDMFLDKEGNIIPGLSLNGAMSAGIPGEPAALVYIATHFGRLPLSQSLAPAIRLAKEGFPVDAQFIYFSTMGDRLDQLKRFKPSADIFLHEANAYKLGELFRQPDLANTLTIIAEKGHDGFYKGKIAELLVEGVKKEGGIWCLEDLSNYQVKLREPLVGAYHNMLIITVPPPSAGGVILLTSLNILQSFALDSYSKIKWIHYVVEAMRLSYWQSNRFLGDPDFVQIDLNKLVSMDNAKLLRALIMPDKATQSSNLEGKQVSDNSTNTTQIVILDAEGNRVAATMTVNYIFGSSLIAEGTGVLLNDGMDDFSSKTGEKNVFGLVGQAVNAIKPGKRPLSSMTPTFLEMPNRLAILGTPGGSRIPSMVLLSTLSFFNGSGAITLVSGMRFHHQYLPDLLQFEPETFTASTQEGLKAMGYELMGLKQYYGDMQAITWDKTENIITAASDPRHMGLATVVMNSSNGGYGVGH